MTPQQLQAMKLALEALKNNKLTHLYCEDTWYSCPKHEDGCANEAEGDECNCGADDVNAQFDKAITALEEALAQPEQEPVPVTDNTYAYAKSLAEAIFKQHFSSDEHYASGRIVWGVNDSVIGILTQIDNMVADMVRRPEQPERHELQAKGEHPAPCARYCEANAFKIVIKNLKAQLAQPEQEPVAHCKVRPLRGDESFPKVEIDWVNQPIPGPLYTTTPQRKPLLASDIVTMYDENPRSDNEMIAFARAIEAAHNIKENT